MNNTFKFSALLFLIIFLLSCEEKPTPPVLATSNVTEITTTSAVSGGVISNDGGAPIISRGICWNTSNDPAIDNFFTTETGESVSFSSNLTDLSPKTLYYVRAYATNSVGTGYGESVSFTTLGDAPVSIAANATNIGIDSAVLNGTVNPNSLSTTVSFEWGTTTNYGNTIAATQSPVTGNTSVSVSVKLTELLPGTTYHFRTKAENSLGITYSSDMTFTTPGDAPSVIAQDATNLQVETATLNGSVNPNYLSSTVTFEWGTTTSYGNTISSSQSPVTGSTSVNVSADLSGLAPGTTYHFRINATNELGTTNSTDLTFTTLGDVPSVTVQDATDVKLEAATLNGSVNANYLSSTVMFEWGTTTDYGNTVTATESPATGSTSANVSVDLTGLTPGTTYHFRIVATNELGTTNSDDMLFTTLGHVPTAITQTTTNLKVNTVTLNGSVNPNYLSTTVTFEWGTTTDYGNTITALQSPLTGSTLVNISADLSVLTPETTYHFRISATNELGTTNSTDLTFTTYAVADADNNLYHSVTIGTQIWINENLKTTYYNNDTDIPNIIDNTEWNNLTTSAYCWYNNDETANKNTYGALYNWYAVNTGNLCPTGWHVPTDAEWTTLINYLGGEDVAGTKLKESGTLHWIGSNPYATNVSGFSVLPAGDRGNNGQFGNLHLGAYFWHPTEYSLEVGQITYIQYNPNAYISPFNKVFGASVRCIKD